MSEQAIIAMMRVADLPNPYVPSEIVLCHRCGQDCWVSRVLLPTAKAMQMTPLCVWCVPAGEGGER